MTLHGPGNLHTLIVALDHYGVFHHDRHDGLLMAMANIGGLLLLMTLCAWIVELVFAVKHGPGDTRRSPLVPTWARTE